MAGQSNTSLQPPRIRGGIVSTSIHWVRDVYGEALLQRVLGRLTPEERTAFSGTILPISWYPLSSWMAFLDACRAEVREHFGEDGDIFDRRSLREPGGRFLQTIYRFVLSFVRPETTISKLPLIIDRTFDQGSTEVLQNRPGFCLIRFQGPASMYLHIKRFGVGSASFLLEYSGASDIQATLTRNELSAGNYVLEVSVSYQVK
jgi:hypothetical protein